MSWPLVRNLCGIFCCPPFPSRIAAKLAFVPPEATYSIIGDVESRQMLRLAETADWQYSQRELDMIEPFTTMTSRGEHIACMFFHYTGPSAAKYTILYSHGNAVDIGQMSSFLVFLGTQLKCNVLTYDYSGYGVSTGEPTEANLYADIDAACNVLRHRYGIKPEEIVLYGQSIGTVPTVDLASKLPVGGVILHSPLMSGVRLAFPQTKQTWFFDAFPSIDKVERITSVVLVIHGTEDEVINISHGQAIYQRCPKTVEPLWVEGAGHNDIEHYDEYFERLSKFINREIETS